LRSLGTSRVRGFAMDPSGATEQDGTVQAFTRWLTEVRSKSTRTVQEMLSEVSIIRDGITTNNVELTDFKRHSTGVSQQMQSQLTDLREKLTSAYSEITSLVKQKIQSDQEMMQDINWLQQNLASKTAELEALKKSYSQAHQQLQSCLIQIQNHLQVTQTEVVAAKSSCDRVYKDTSSKFVEIDDGLKSMEEQLSIGSAENRNQMSQLQEEIGRIRQSLASVNAEFLDYKKTTTATHNRLQSQVWGLEEGQRRQPASYQPERVEAVASPTAYVLPAGARLPQGYPAAAMPMGMRPSAPAMACMQQPMWGHR